MVNCISRRWIPAVVVLALLLLAWGCGSQKAQEVVIYTPVDREFSEPILRDFESQSGIRVKALYDIEAAKAAGLTNRLLAEKGTPRCDVWWNSEFARTILLKDAGVLERYESPSAQDIPARWKDPDGYWTGYAVRGRVLIYNSSLVKPQDAPKSVLDLADARWKGKAGLPNPAFGTTSSHCAALFLEMGDAKAGQFFSTLKKNGLVICPGNATVRDRVVSGDLLVGIVDTDDANLAIERGQPLEMVLPDQDGLGVFVIPNTVSLVKNCPHPEAGKNLMDYLLSREIEARLASSGSAQIPVRSGVPPPRRIRALGEFKASDVDYAAVAHKMPETNRILSEMLVR